MASPLTINSTTESLKKEETQVLSQSCPPVRCYGSVNSTWSSKDNNLQNTSTWAAQCDKSPTSPCRSSSDGGFFVVGGGLSESIDHPGEVRAI